MTIDDRLEQIQVPVTLGLDSWAWILTMMPDDDLTTENLRNQIARHPSVTQCRVLSELRKSK